MELERLLQPFPAEAIHWRVGATTKDKDKGIALAYIDARDVMERLDEVCEVGGWQCRYPFVGCCEIGILIEREWVWKSNGAGVTDYEAEKGQYSDAFKRAAVMWGIGRYLYSLPNEWVPIKAAGRSYKIVTPPVLPKWALPGMVDVPRKVVQEVMKQSIAAMEAKDSLALREVWSEFGSDEQSMLWGKFSSQQRSTMKEMMSDNG